MMRAAAWGSRGEGYEATQRPVKRQETGNPPGELSALDYASQLDRIEATLQSLFGAIQSSGSGAGPARPTQPELTKAAQSLDATRDLAGKIENSRIGGLEQTVMQSLEHISGELRRSVAVIDPRTRIGEFEREPKALCKNDLATKTEPTPFPIKERQSRVVHDLLKPNVGQEARSERAEQKPLLPNNLERQRTARENIAEIRAFQDGSRALRKIEERIDAVAGKVEEAIAEARNPSRFDSLLQHVENVRQELTVRIAESWLAPDTKPLEELLRGLAEKLDKTQKSQADKQTVEALERQLSELKAGLSSQTAMEGMISDLFAEIERTRESALEAAETAARNVLKDGSDRAFDADIGQEIQRLRSVRDGADQRTLSALTTVHDVLDKLINRLAFIEEELSNRPKSGKLQGHPEEQGQEQSEEKMKASHADDAFVELRDSLPDKIDGKATGNLRKVAAVQDLRSGVMRADPVAAHSAAERSGGPKLEQAPVAKPIRTNPGSPGLLRETHYFGVEPKRPVVLSLMAICVALGAYAVVEITGQKQLADVFLNSRNTIRAVSPQTVSLAPVPQAYVAPPTVLAPVLTPAAAVEVAPSSSEGDEQPMAASGPSPVDFAVKPKIMPREVTFDDLQAAAESGNIRAQFALATHYAEVSRNLAAAARWYQKAAAQGFAPAEFRLGFLYQNGLGVPRDLEQAGAWYLKAAKQGNISAMHYLAIVAAEGTPDYTTAAEWFRKAADYGVINSQYNLALLLAAGRGVRQNLTSAYTWFAIAAAEGDDVAAKKRDELAARLDARQLAAAKSAAASFRAKTPDAAANDDQVLAADWTFSTSGSGKTPGPKASEL